MGTDRNRLFYLIGTGLLFVAIVEVTFLPYLIMRFFPSFFIPVDTHTKVIASIDCLAFICYLFSPKYYIKQLGTVVVIFLIYALFQIILQQI